MNDNPWKVVIENLLTGRNRMFEVMVQSGFSETEAATRSIETYRAPLDHAIRQAKDCMALNITAKPSNEVQNER